jgi:3-methyladenine DNA glycosylase/8-oxoguanine DNA glycosylase
MSSVRRVASKEIKTAIQTLSKVDKKLGKLIEDVGSCRLELAHMHSPFDSLVESIIYQQLNGKAAATIFSRVQALFPDSTYPTADDLLNATDELLRSAGVSGAKTRALKDLAAKAKAGMVPSLVQMNELNNEELIEQLTQIRGVGQWTVEMLLIFRLGRLDVLPCTDYGVRKGFSLTYRRKELPTPRELFNFGERWRPYRTIASWYLWRAADLK